MNVRRRCLIISLVSMSVCLVRSPLKSIALSASQNREDGLSSLAIDAKEEIRRVVTDSQLNETLKIYVYPSNFDRSLLGRYWVPESKGGKAIVKIENSVRRLVDRGWHYDKESANEKLDILSIKVWPQGNVADVRTHERWYVPMVDAEGMPVKDREPFLEYSCTYRLLRVDGKWLIMTTTVPYHED